MSYEPAEHEHRYFIFKTYDCYEPFEKQKVLQTYIKIEYAILGCNCGSVIKMKVQE